MASLDDDERDGAEAEQSATMRGASSSGQERIFRSVRPSGPTPPARSADRGAQDRRVTGGRDGPGDPDARSVVHGPLPAPAPLPVPERVREAVVEPIGSPPVTKPEPAVPAGDDRPVPAEPERRGQEPAPARSTRSRVGAPRAGEQRGAGPVFRPDLIRSAGNGRVAGDDGPQRASAQDDLPADPADSAWDEVGRDEPSAMEALASLYPPPDGAEAQSSGKSRRRRLRRS